MNRVSMPSVPSVRVRTAIVVRRNAAAFACSPRCKSVRARFEVEISVLMFPGPNTSMKVSKMLRCT